jgi:hypothetical protein
LGDLDSLNGLTATTAPASCLILVLVGVTLGSGRHGHREQREQEDQRKHLSPGAGVLQTSIRADRCAIFHNTAATITRLFVMKYRIREKTGRGRMVAFPCLVIVLPPLNRLTAIASKSARASLARAFGSCGGLALQDMSAVTAGVSAANLIPRERHRFNFCRDARR